MMCRLLALRAYNLGGALLRRRLRACVCVEKMRQNLCQKICVFLSLYSQFNITRITVNTCLSYFSRICELSYRHLSFWKVEFLRETVMLAFL